MFERKKKKKKPVHIPAYAAQGGDVRCYESYFLFSTSRALKTVTILLLRYRCYINIYIHTQTKARDRNIYLYIYIYVVIFLLATSGAERGGGNQRCYFSAGVLRNETKKREREKTKSSVQSVLLIFL